MAVYVNQKFTTAQINKVKGMYYINLGDAAYRELKMHKAIKLYNHGVKLFPGHYGGWENLGNIYVAYEDYPAALYAYSQAFKHNPSLMTARMKYGVIATQKMGNFDDALVQFNEVVNTKRKLITIPFIYDNAESTKQNKAIAYYNIGVTYRLKSLYSGDDWEKQRKYLSEAIQAYIKSLEIVPYKYDTLYNLGLAYHIAERYNDAGVLYCKAIKMKPMSYEAHYNLGVLLRRMRKYQDSYDELEKAATLITALDEDDVQIQYVALILNDIMTQIHANESYKRQLEREKLEEELIRQARSRTWHFNIKFFSKKEHYDEYNEDFWYEEDIKNKKKKKSTLGDGIKIIKGKVTATEDLDKAVTEEFSKCPALKYFKGVYD